MRPHGPPGPELSHLYKMMVLQSQPIAIVGMGCRFPGSVNNPESFWQLLMSEVDAIGEIPAGRFDVGAYYDARPGTPGKMSTRWGGFLDRIDEFDASFFGISPREAERMDPQQRLLLEVAYEALEDAGIAPRRLIGTQTGVFVGQWLSDYEARLSMNPRIDFYMTTGTGRYATSGRVSYVFGLQGPSMTVDTACSSSLVAVHLACQSLRAGESTLALAGAVNIILQPHVTIAYSQSQMMAPDGRCKFGDARADGYVRSEGIALIVLKPLSQALADRDRIHAVIMGSAVNNDGRSSGFMTTPGQAGQENLLRRAYANSGVSSGQIKYIEAHGTGTRAGDPVEIGALGAVLSEGRSPDAPCIIGSVKTNIGHTEAAAGLAGLIKVTLSLEHDMIPASLHVRELNPDIAWDRLPLEISRSASPWSKGTEPALAGISAFGITGTNAHVVLRQAPEPTHTPTVPASTRNYRILPLSAANADALKAFAGSYRAYLGDPGLELESICYTASVRRDHYPYRLALVAQSPQEMTAQLEAFLRSQACAGLAAGQAREHHKIVFVFPGQGSQWIGMGRQLFQSEPVFRKALEQCHQAIQEHAAWSLLDVLLTDSPAALDEIDIVQPALFAIQVALAALWRSWGIHPDAAVGHSMGEVAAAHVASVLSLKDAVHVICSRSKLMKTVSGRGAMAVVALTEQETRQALRGHERAVTIAVINGQQSTVISGDADIVKQLIADFKARDIFCHQVKVDIAAHSPQMEPLVKALEAELSDVHPHSGSIPLYSTVTGQSINGAELDAGYWGKNLCQPVLFYSATERLKKDAHTIFIELSPHPVLLPAIETRAESDQSLILVHSLRREQEEQAEMVTGLARLYTVGYPVPWEKFYPFGGQVVTLPGYPWQRERYWLEQNQNSAPEHTVNAAAQETESKNLFLGSRLDLANPLPGIVWETTLDHRRFPALTEHRLQGAAVMSASTYLVMARAAASESYGKEVTLTRVEFRRAFELAEKEPVRVQVWLTPLQDGSATLQIYSNQDGEWLLCFTCQASQTGNPGDAPFQASAPEKESPEQLQIDAIQAGCAALSSGADYYQTLAENGIQIGQPLQGIRQVWQNHTETLAHLRTEIDNANDSTGMAHLDACFQLLGQFSTGSGQIKIPIAIRRIRFHGGFHSGEWAYARRVGSGDEESVDLALSNHKGAPVVEIKGVELTKWTGVTYPSKIRHDWLYEIQWQVRAKKQNTTPVRHASWLILGDRLGVGSALAQLLEQQGHHCILIPLTGALAPEKASGQIDLPSIGQKIQDAIHASGTRLKGVIHLWGLDSSFPDEPTPALLEQAQRLGCGTALNVIQELAQKDWQEPPRLWLITRGAQAISPEENIHFAQAPLWGLGRTVAEEHNEFWGGLIDLDPMASAFECAAQIQAQVVESAAEDQIAFRQGRRYVARLTRFSKETVSRALPWRPDGAYLITGGGGGVGLALARWLVQQGVRHLILMGRTPLPPRAAREQLDDSRLDEFIRAIQELEAQGASVQYAAVDVADESQMIEFLEFYRRENKPPIIGVFHAASVFSNRLLTQLTTDSLFEVIRPKLVGGWVLQRLFPDVDFMVFFSSIAGLLPQAGQANYAAANVGLDALSAYCRARGKNVLCIDWGIWHGLGSMRADSPGQRAADQLVEQGIASFTKEQGLSVLAHLFRQDVHRVIVMPVEWSRFKNSPAAKRRHSFFAELITHESVPHAQPDNGLAKNAAWIRSELLASPAEQRKGLLEGYVQEHIGKVLGMPAFRIDTHSPLGSYGLDSLMAIELRNRLDHALGLKLSATVVWNYPTVSELAAFLAKKMEIPLVDDVPVHSQAVVHASDKRSDQNQILAEIESLSDEDAMKELRQRKMTGGRK